MFVSLNYYLSLTQSNLMLVGMSLHLFYVICFPPPVCFLFISCALCTWCSFLLVIVRDASKAVDRGSFACHFSTG